MSADIVPVGLDGMELLWRFAQRVAETEFVPQAFRRRPDAVLAAIQFGRELGIGPMQSLQSIDVIQGKPTLSAEAMRARVFTAGHKIETEEYTNEKCILVGTRGDNGSKERVVFSLEDAARAGLANKDSWKKYPRSMLLARATSELCRLLFPDVLSSVSYVPEELEREPDSSVYVQAAVDPVSGAEVLESLNVNVKDTEDVTLVEPVSKLKIHDLQARVASLQARHVKVADARKQAELPVLKDGLSEVEFAEWEALVTDLERDNP